jgi:thioredoxin-related protein
MKTIVPLLLLLTVCTSRAQTWMPNLDLALKEAAQENKKVLMFFTLSENCENCKALEDNVFKTDQFRMFSLAGYVLVKVDFSMQSADKVSDAVAERNLLIVEKYNKDGFFPLVVVLNKNAKILGKSGIYKEETPSQFIEKMRSFDTKS